jgi:transcriptional regulator with XRE-family HTH domain
MDTPKGASVGRRIKSKREDAGWSQTELAKRAGITPSALSQIESGDRFPSTVVVHKLAKALSTSVDYLLGNKTEEDLSDLLQDEKVEVLFRTFKELSKKDREFILRQIDALKPRKK